MKIFGTDYAVVKDLEYGRVISPVGDEKAQYLLEFDGVAYKLMNIKTGNLWNITRDNVQEAWL